MHIHDATEVAYKNGYEAGEKAATERILKDLETNIREHSVLWAYQSRVGLLEMLAEFKKKYGVN